MGAPRRELSDADRRVVQELVDEHIQVSCDLVFIDENTWAIHASIAVDGEVLVAEFDNRADAQSALEQIAAAEQEMDTRTGSSEPLGRKAVDEATLRNWDSRP
jgi:hypothetical protein